VNDSAGEWMSCSVKLHACSKQQRVEMLNVSSRHNQITGEHIYKMKCCEFGGFACHIIYVCSMVCIGYIDSKSLSLPCFIQCMYSCFKRCVCS
jgi:hypothetical protein